MLGVENRALCLDVAHQKRFQKHPRIISCIKNFMLTLILPDFQDTERERVRSAGSILAVVVTVNSRHHKNYAELAFYVDLLICLRSLCGSPAGELVALIQFIFIYFGNDLS